MWTLTFVASYIESVVGLAVAAVLLPQVTLSPTGAAEAAFVLALAEWLMFVPLWWMKRARAKVRAVPVALFVVSPLILTLGFVAAVALVPGFAVDGFWAFVAAEVIVYAVSLSLGSVSEKALPRIAAKP